MSGRVGWYRLNRGRGPVFHGTLPPGAVEIDAPGTTPAAPSIARPADSAKKAAWVAYAEALGVDSSGTRAELIARCDEQVDALDRGGEFGSEPLVDERGTDGAELVDGEGVVDGLDEDPDAVGHGG